MYYLPFFITALYVYLSVKKSKLQTQDSPPSDVVLTNIMVNLAITEVISMFGWMYDLITCDCNFSFTHLVLFYVVQDIYFYCVHRYVFHLWMYKFHALHHKFIVAYAAWYGHPLEHIFLNIGSVIVPFWIFPNPPWVLFMIMIQQIYTSVSGHTPNSPHSVHHKYPTKRFGSAYLIDRLTDTF